MAYDPLLKQITRSSGGGGTPSGPAGGDLSGTYPNPTVSKINGNTLGSTTPTAGNLLIGSGAAWVTQAVSGDATLSSGGVLTLSTVSVSKGGTGDTSLTAHGVLIGEGTSPVTVTSPGTSGQLFIGQGATSDPSFNTMSGDATINNTGVLTLATVNANTGTWGDSTHVGQFTVNAKGLITAASNVLITGAAPTGPAGGDLSGTYPNPTVAKINTVSLGSTTATSGNLLIASGTQWVTQAMSGDATINSTGVLTLATVNSNVGTFGDSNHVGQFTVNAKGLITAASNVTLPAGSNFILNSYRFSCFAARLATGTIDRLLVNFTETGGGAALSEAPDYYSQYTTAGTTGSNCGWSDTNNQFPYNRKPLMNMFTRTANNISDPRIWIGVFSGDPRGSNDPAGLHLAGFRYAGGVDTNWRACTKDGTTLTNIDTGVVVATATRYVFVIDMNTSSSQIDFYINGSLVASSTTHLPSASTGLSPYLALQTTTNNARSLFLEEWNAIVL